MSNKKRYVQILEALSKAADVDLEYTDENPETEDNFEGVKDSGKKDMPKEKFDKAGGMGKPKKIDTDPTMDKVTETPGGGAKQKDSKQLKKEAFLVKKIEEITGKRVTLKEYYDEPEETVTAPVNASAVTTSTKAPVTREELQRRKDFDKKYTQANINNLQKIIAQSEAQKAAGQEPTNSIGHAQSLIAKYQRELQEDTPLDKYIDMGEELQENTMEEASRAERIARGKGTGNLKV